MTEADRRAAQLAQQLDGPLADLAALLADLQRLCPTDISPDVLADLTALAKCEVGLRTRLATTIANLTNGDPGAQSMMPSLSALRHDLRTPLNGLRGYAELVMEELPNWPAGRALLEAVRAISDQVLDVVDTVLGATLPACDDEAAVADASHWGAPARILVIDDNTDNLIVLTRHLQRDGHEVVAEDSGMAALDRLLTRREEFDLLLLDYRLPDIEGTRVLELLKADPRLVRLPVLMISAGMDVEGIVRCIDLGAEDHLPKPFDPVLLRARISASLDKKRLREREEASWQQRLRSVMALVPDALLILNQDGRIEAANDAALVLFAIDGDGLISQPVARFLRLPSEAGADVAHLRGLAAGAAADGEGLRADGSRFAAELTVKELRQEDRQIFTVTVRDVSERKEAEARTAFLASHDPLTGLFNRAGMLEVLAATGTGHCLLIDLLPDREMADWLVPGLDEAMQRAMAARLESLLAPNDRLGRLDGTEFVLLRPGNNDDAAAVQLGEAIVDLFQPPLDADGTEVDLRVMIGISRLDGGPTMAEEWLKEALLAAMKARSHGDGAVVTYHPNLLAAARRQKQLQRSLRHAVAEQQFELRYQPKIALADGCVIGVEALLRWHHPRDGWISPAEFIPVAESSGLIQPLGEWVLETACRQARRWSEQGLRLPVAVNVSAVQFRRRTIVETVARILDQSGLEPDLLEVEITESAIMDDADGVRDMLAELRRAGVAVTIDDFGTGFSSLSYLQHLPLNKLKIDRSFVRDVTSNSRSQAIANTIVALADRLGLITIAEGVENIDQASFLRAIGCAQAQGFAYAPALVADELLAYARRPVGLN